MFEDHACISTHLVEKSHQITGGWAIKTQSGGYQNTGRCTVYENPAPEIPWVDVE